MIQSQIFGLIYALGTVPLIAYLWYSGRMNLRIATLFLAAEKRYLMILRGIVFILFIALGTFFLISLLGFFGIHEFFSFQMASVFLQSLLCFL